MSSLVGLPSDSDVDLPPDVPSSGDESVESAIELPDQILAGEPCCSKRCCERLSAFGKECSSRLNFNLDNLDLQNKNAIWFNQLLNMNRAAPEGARRKSFLWHGHELCLRGWSSVTGCPVKKVRQYLKAIAEGEVVVPLDGRKAPLKKPEPKTEDVESFFSFVYEHLAEPLGAARDQLADGEVDESSDLVAVPDWLANQDLVDIAPLAINTMAALGPKPMLPKRWLPTMTPSELFDLYKDLHCDHAALASWSTFSRAWARWQSILGIRPAQVHSRCDDCARYSKFRRLQSNPADTKAVTQAYKQHIQEVFADRSIVTSLENMSEQAMRTEDMPVPHLVFTIDAMDKSKWQLPRQLDNTKRLSALWRPCLHLVGVLVAGVCEYFSITEGDIKGDSDLQQTLLSRALQVAEEELRARGKAVPSRVVYHFDNTSKEGRNSFLVSYCAAMVSSGRFTECSMLLYKVGHTHNRLDQRFGVIASKLSRAASLQTPSDYTASLQQNYQPARGVKLVVEEVHGAHHWREFFAPLQTHFAGMQGSGTTADAAHLLRIVRRDMVKTAVPDIPFEDEGHGSDPVLLAKHWISSKILSQPPTVLLQGDLGLDFPRLLDMRAPRTELTPESVKQFKRTAIEVLAEPWKLDGTSAYLMSWLQRNAANGPHPPLPDISFLVEGRSFLPESHAALPTWKDFAPQGAVPVRPIHRPNAKARALKRPAAAPQLAHVSRRAQALSNMMGELQVEDGSGLVGVDVMDLLAGKVLDNSQQPSSSKDNDNAPALRDVEGPGDDEAASDPESEPEDVQEPLRRPAAGQAPCRPVGGRGLKRPAAAVGSAKAKPKPKAKAAAGSLGCSKCRFAAGGCTQCRLRQLRG